MNIRGTPSASIAVAVATLLALLFALSLLGLVSTLQAEGWGAALSGLIGDVYIWRTWRFTLFQAALSTLLSLLLALPVAYALVRRRFPGRRWLLQLSTLSFVLPPIVVAFGLIELFGRSGWLSTALGLVGVSPGSWVFGLDGILIAHVFFNAPLAVRYFTAALATTPQQTWRLTEQLNVQGLRRLWLVDVPQLRAVLPGTALLIFLLCFTSFTLVLALGGGPRTNSLEVSIYEALKFQADFARAGLLALVQMATLVAIAVVLTLTAKDLPLFPSTAQPAQRPGQPPWWDWPVLIVFSGFILLPLLAVVADGATPRLAALLADPLVWRALWTSVWIGTAAALLATLFAICLNRLGPAASAAGLVLLILPSFLFITGLFVVARQAAPLAGIRAMDLGPALLVVVNALLALPFAIRAIGPAQRQIARRHDRLCAGLGLRGPRRWLRIDLPLLRAPLGLAFGLAAALSIGDFGVIAFFGNEDFQTLPLLLHRGLSSYRFTDGGALALIILALALAFFWLGQLVGGGVKYAPR